MNRSVFTLIVVAIVAAFAVPVALAQELPATGTYRIVNAPSEGAEFYDDQEDSSLLERLENGTSVQVVEWDAEDLNWAKVSYGELVGVVHAQYLELVEADPVDPNQEPQQQDELSLPTVPQELPNALPAGISNEDADMPACQSRMDMNESCSTQEGQAVEGSFTLGDAERPELRLHNGDVIEIVDAAGQPLFPRIPVEVSGTNHDMVLLYTSEGAGAVNLYVNADYGSNRQNFYAAIPRMEFSASDVVDVLAHQLRLALVQSEPAEEACQPGVEDCYPEFINPRNCASVEDLSISEVVTYCDAINIYVAVWNGQSWDMLMYGVYGLLRDDDGTASEAAYVDLRDRMPEFVQ